MQVYCDETLAMCQQPRKYKKHVHRFAKDLVQYLALHLAEMMAELFQIVLDYPSQGLVDASNASLLAPKFWVQSIYTELLHAGCRLRAVREKEEQGSATGLVKVTCLPFDGLAVARHKSKKKSETSHVSML